MSKYQSGKIYKIVCNKTNDVYIGSTIRDLDARLKRHISDYERDAKRKCESYKIIKRGDYKIELVESYACNSRKELYQRETHWMNEIKCINKCKSYRSEEEAKQYYINWCNDNKERIKKNNKEYNEKNKERLKEYHRQNHIKNKDAICERVRKWQNEHKNDEEYKQKRRQYREEHKEYNKNYHKAWRQENKDTIKEKNRLKYLRTKHLRKPSITCICGGTHEDTPSKKERHDLTKKHIQYINSL